MNHGILEDIAEGPWLVDGDEATCEGEHADDVPTWEVWDLGDEARLRRIIGWYEQTGEARWDDLPALARAMDAADAALEQSIRRSREGAR